VGEDSTGRRSCETTRVRHGTVLRLTGGSSRIFQRVGAAPGRTSGICDRRRNLNRWGWRGFEVWKEMCGREDIVTGLFVSGQS